MGCMICEKHRDFEKYSGQPIAEEAGLVVSHFPVINGGSAPQGRLVIESRRHIEDVMDLNPEETAALGALIRKAVGLLIREVDAKHAYVYRINDLVAHFHFHIIPRFENTPKEYHGLKITEWPDSKKLNLKEVQKLSLRLQERWPS